MSGTANVSAPTLARTSNYARADHALRAILDGEVRAGGMSLAPSGVDALVCTIARQSLAMNLDGIGIALPRGRTAIAGLLGTYLTLHRWQNQNLHGSVLVATSDPNVSKLFSELDSLHQSGLEAGRLVARPKRNELRLMDGSVRPAERVAAMRPFGPGGAIGLSQKDGKLLFCRPGSIPAPPARQVFCCAVVETAGSSSPHPGRSASTDGTDAWSAAHRLLAEAGVPSIWLGDLGDELFRDFCSARSFPVVEAGWPLITELAGFEPFGPGTPPLSSSGLCARSANRPPIELRPVLDDHRAAHVKSAYMLLAKMRRAAKNDPMPAPVKAAYRYLAITSRLACPLEAYEQAAMVGSAVFNQPVRALLQRDIRQSNSGDFRGRWKEGWRRHWDALVGELAAVADVAEGEPQKLYALFDEIALAQKQGRRLVVCVQTRTERRALLSTLEELDASDGVTVTTFATRERAGDGSTRRRVVLLAPPPPWQTPLLLSGEGGRTVTLCYPWEEPKLREAVTRAEARYGDDRYNETQLSQLGVNGRNPVMQDTWVPTAPALKRLAAYGETDDDGFDDARFETLFEPIWGPIDEPVKGEELELRDIVDLWGEGIAEEPAVDEAVTDPITTAGQGWDGLVHVIRFAQAPPVAFRADKTVDVLADSSGNLAEISSKRPAKLQPGEVVAFLPGVEHHSLRDALMSAWDSTLAAERAICEPLWRKAIENAVAVYGTKGLADRCGRSEAAIRTWLDGTATPQQRDDFDQVLEMAAVPAAFEARQAIWELLRRTRGMHRQIGSLLNAALAEAVAGGPHPSVDRLEDLTRTDVGDLLDVAEPLTVLSVGPPVLATAYDTGRYLPQDHPLLNERNVL